MPLLQLFNTLTDPSTPEEVDKSLVLDHVTSALILLGSASQVVALTRQRAFDELLDKRFDSIKKNAPSADFLFGGTYRHRGRRKSEQARLQGDTGTTILFQVKPLDPLYGSLVSQTGQKSTLFS